MKRSEHARDQPVLVPFKTVSDNFRDRPAKMSSHSFLSSCEQFDVLLQNWYSLFTIKVCSWTFFSQLFPDHFPGVDETWHATGYEPSPGESGDV